jgi:hypothetical protein
LKLSDRPSFEEGRKLVLPSHKPFRNLDTNSDNEEIVSPITAKRLSMITISLNGEHILYQGKEKVLELLEDEN